MTASGEWLLRAARHLAGHWLYSHDGYCCLGCNAACNELSGLHIRRSSPELELPAAGMAAIGEHQRPQQRRVPGRRPNQKSGQLPLLRRLLPPFITLRDAQCQLHPSLHLVVKLTDSQPSFVNAAGYTSLLSRQTRMQKRALGSGCYRDRRAFDEPNSGSSSAAAAPWHHERRDAKQTRRARTCRTSV